MCGRTLPSTCCMTCPSVKDIASSARAAGENWRRAGRSPRWGFCAQASPIPSTSGRTPSGTAISSTSVRIAGVDPYAHPQTITDWLNPAAFSMPAAGTFGNCGRNTIYGPNFRNVDFSVLKGFKLGETSLEFRAEFFNVFNHPAFAQPNTTFGTPGFGEIFNTLGRTLGAGTSRQIQLALKFSF